MYGSVLGASVTAGSVAVLPNTGGSKLSLYITLVCLIAGVALTTVTVARNLAAKRFSS
jgi:hypothetical protein